MGRSPRERNLSEDERRHQVQDDVPEAVADDRAPEVLRLQDDVSIEQPDGEDERHVDRAEEEDVERREDRGHKEQAAGVPEALDRALQQEPAEDQLLREARRE